MRWGVSQAKNPETKEQVQALSQPREEGCTSRGLWVRGEGAGLVSLGPLLSSNPSFWAPTLSSVPGFTASDPRNQSRSYLPSCRGRAGPSFPLYIFSQAPHPAHTPPPASSSPHISRAASANAGSPLPLVSEDECPVISVLLSFQGLWRPLILGVTPEEASSPRQVGMETSKHWTTIAGSLRAGEEQGYVFSQSSTHRLPN